MTIGLIFSQLRMEETWNLCVNLRKPAETRKGFLYCWNCTATYYIMFQLTETLRKLSVCFRTAETGLKLTHQVSTDGNLTESSWNYTIISILLKLYRNCNSKFLYRFSSVSVLLKLYFSSSESGYIIFWVLSISNERYVCNYNINLCKNWSHDLRVTWDKLKNQRLRYVQFSISHRHNLLGIKTSLSEFVKYHLYFVESVVALNEFLYLLLKSCFNAALWSINTVNNYSGVQFF